MASAWGGSLRIRAKNRRFDLEVTMKIIQDNRGVPPVAVLNDNVLRFIGRLGNYYAIEFGDGAQAWESDKGSFDESVAEGGRLLYPGDRVTLEF